MSKFTLDTAIKYCLEVAKKNECKMTSDDRYTNVSMKQCATDYRQLAEWLLQLKDLREIFFKVDIGKASPKDYLDLLNEWGKTREILKAVVDDLNEVIQTRYYLSKWRYTNEALKPIGDGENGCL